MWPFNKKPELKYPLGYRTCTKCNAEFVWDYSNGTKTDYCDNCRPPVYKVLKPVKAD